MSVRNTLEKMVAGSSVEAAEAQDARHWLARTEVFLDWVARHPRLVEVNNEAAHLLAALRGADSVPPVDVDYRGVGNRPRPATGGR